MFLISKDDIKIRIQSTDFAAIYFIFKETIIRFESLFGKISSGKIIMLLN